MKPAEIIWFIEKNLSNLIKNIETSAFAISVSGVFWESGLQARRFEALPNACDSRHGAVWAVEDGSVQELLSKCPGRLGGTNSCSGAPLDTSVPGAEVRRKTVGDMIKAAPRKMLNKSQSDKKNVFELAVIFINIFFMFA